MIKEVAKRVRMPIRGISNSTLKFYDTTIGVDSDGVPVEHYYKYPNGMKTRTLPKSFTTTGQLTNTLFGMDKFQSGQHRKISITEGELDAMSLYQMTEAPAVSLSGATPSWSGLWKNCREFLDGFDQIIIVTDNDRAGNRAAEVIASQFPNKSYRVSMDLFKDANEYLMENKATEFKASWFRAKKYVPDFDISTSEQFIEVLREGVDAPYQEIGIKDYDERMLGLFQGHFTLFTAPEGIGKTEFMRFIEYQMIQKEIPIAVCHLEETDKRTLLGLASYALDKNVTRSDLIEDQDEVDSAVSKMGEHENLHLFTIGVEEDPLVLLERIKYYATVCGCKYLFFEPIQDLAYQRVGDETTEAFLSKLAVAISRACSEYGIGVVSIAHMNDDGQVRDCRMIPKRASVVVELERDLKSEDDNIRNLTKLTCIKNRPATVTGYCGMLRFDVDTFTLTEAFND